MSVEEDDHEKTVTDIAADFAKWSEKARAITEPTAPQKLEPVDSSDQEIFKRLRELRPHYYPGITDAGVNEYIFNKHITPPNYPREEIDFEYRHKKKECNALWDLFARRHICGEMARHSKEALLDGYNENCWINLRPRSLR